MIVIRVSRRRRIRPRHENRIQMRRMKMDEDAVGPRGNHEKEYDSSLNQSIEQMLLVHHLKYKMQYFF
jgi:hypothetical protein